MTFLLQKFNAINRTRTEVRARNGLRSSASGIAFTGRLAACLLLAGFLGVGSAMAQPKVLRLEGGAITINLETEFPNAETTGGGANVAADWGVHHYQIGTMDAVDLTVDDNDANTPASDHNSDEDASFLVGGLALVSINAGMLTIQPVSSGAFKIAVDPDFDAVTDDSDATDDALRPINFEIMSSNAPYLDPPGLGATYNTGANADVVDLDLTPRDNVSKEYDLTEWFSDPNDVFLTYDASVDMVAEMPADPAPTTVPLRPKVDEDGVAIVTAVPDGNKLTVALTDKAMNLDRTDIWVFGRDGSEYARKRIQVTVGSSSLPHVSDTPLQDMILREGAAADTPIALHTGFADPARGPDGGMGTNADIVRMLTYGVEIDDKNAQKVDISDAEYTYVAASMTAEVDLTTAGQANLSIRPRVAGAVKFTVTATDQGVQCREVSGKDAADNDVSFDYIPARSNPDYDADGSGDATRKYLVDTDITEADPATLCIRPDLNNQDANVPTTPDNIVALLSNLVDGDKQPTTTDLFPDSKSVKDEFTITVVTKTTPLTDNAIPALSGKNALDADGDAKTVDLADVDTEADNAQAAFEDPTEQGLTYMAYTSKADSAFVVATVDGSVVTLTPMWRIGRDAETATVKVKATNVDDESTTTSFSVTVNKATKPVVNLLVAPLLGVGYTLNTGDEPRVVNLRNLTGADDPKMAVPLFIDPDAADKDPLPGGLLHKIQVSDVVADHVYENQSEENDITTSAMRIQLDPATAMLTITPTGANSASVTIWGIDRDRNMISATVMITVVSGVGTEGEELPTEVELSQNYPNPFNPQTTIDYALPQAGDVSLVVYDMLGREVDVLLDGPQAAGRHTVRFGANHLPNGTYVYRLVAGDKTITRTMVLVK